MAMLAQTSTRASVQGRAAAFKAVLVPKVALRRAVVARSYDDDELGAPQDVYEFPNPKFIEDCKNNFPENMIANAEEARALLHLNYTYVDVRPALEIDEVGKWKRAINVPFFNSKRVYDAGENKKVVVKEANPQFVQQFQRKFPDKETPLIVGCSDGKSYTLDALEALDEAGYYNLVALKGGYYSFFRKWDNNLRRRRHDGYTENDNHEAAGCGIHGTGAGFERMDKIESWVPPSY